MGQQAGNIRTLTSPTGSRLRSVRLIHRGSRSQSFVNIFDSIHMPPGRFIVFRKSISGPQDNHPGTFNQDICLLITVIKAMESRVSRIFPAPVFVRITQRHRIVGSENLINTVQSVIGIFDESDPIPVGGYSIKNSSYGNYTRNYKCFKWRFQYFTL